MILEGTCESIHPETESMAATAPAQITDETSPETILDHKIGPAQLDIPGMLLKAKSESGRSTFSIAQELGRFVMGKPKLTGDQYFAWRVYDSNTFTKEQKAEFIGSKRSREINWSINTVTHLLRFVDNKVLFGATLTASGIPYPEQVAIVSDTRLPKGMGWLVGKDAIANFLRTTDAYPLFGKPITGNASQSAGVASLTGYDKTTDTLTRHDGTALDVDAFAEEVNEYFGPGGYLFQKRIFPHPDIAKACGTGLGTVRIVTVNEGDGPRPLYAAWKITATDAVADNFWRKGNLLADVDVETGTLRRVRTGGGFRFEEVETHPETGVQLLGWTLPDWNEALETALDAHSLVPMVGIIGWDLALADGGPMIIEGNTFPNHTLYQDATGKGVFSDAVLRGVHERAVARKAKKDADEKARVKSSNRSWKRTQLQNIRDGLDGDDA